ncbi:MAG: hypothetical protein ACR2HQ_12050 [Ilumatobacteraceae bacterium]
MSLGDVAVGGAIATASSAVLAAAGALNRTRTAQNSAKAKLSLAGSYSVTIAHQAQQERLHGQQLTETQLASLAEKTDSVNADAIEAWEDLLLAGSARTIANAGRLLDAIRQLGESTTRILPLPVFKRLVAGVHEARVEVHVGRRFWRRRRFGKQLRSDEPPI